MSRENKGENMKHKKNTVNGLGCPKCKARMKPIKVKIQDADSLVTSFQCADCGYFDFEGKSMEKAIKEIRKKESPLKIKQKIIKLSHGRLGMYINNDVARSLNLKGGEEVYVSVPDKKHLVIDLVTK